MDEETDVADGAGPEGLTDGVGDGLELGAGLLGRLDGLEVPEVPDVGLALGLALLLGGVLALLPALGVTEGVLLALPPGFALALGVLPGEPGELGEADGEAVPGADGVGVGTPRCPEPPSSVTTASDGGSAIWAVH